MSAIDESLLRALYQNLSETPLEPNSPFYEPIEKVSGRHIERLERHIILNPVESVQFFSGFSGSGKTTELLRLQSRLESQGYFVVYANALSYLNPAGPIDITDLLLILAGAFSDELKVRLQADVRKEPYWNRFKNFLRNIEINAKLQDLAKSLGFDIPDFDIKANIKENPTFRQKIQQILSQHIVALKKDTDQFFMDCVEAIRRERGHDTSVVFIFDSLEQLHGSFLNEDRIIESVIRLFENHQAKLSIPYIHMVYTVPPWLKFMLSGAITSPLIMVPSIRQWENDPDRTPHSEGSRILRSLARRRFTSYGEKKVYSIEDVFGDESRVERLIAVCGGHFRDLLLMLREVLLQAESFPVSDTVLDRAISEARKQYLPLSVSDAHWLAHIAEKRRPDPKNQKDAHHLTRLLNKHLVLYLLNGEEWYDVHPLIRGEVEKIVADNPLQPSDSSASHAETE